MLTISLGITTLLIESQVRLINHQLKVPLQSQPPTFSPAYMDSYNNHDLTGPWLIDYITPLGKVGHTGSSSSMSRFGFVCVCFVLLFSLLRECGRLN